MMPLIELSFSGSSSLSVSERSFSERLCLDLTVATGPRVVISMSVLSGLEIRLILRVITHVEHPVLLMISLPRLSLTDFDSNYLGESLRKLEEVHLIFRYPNHPSQQVRSNIQQITFFVYSHLLRNCRKVSYHFFVLSCMRYVNVPESLGIRHQGLTHQCFEWR